MTKPDPPALSAGQVRFLAAYREVLAIATAARRSGVHRATVYRWQADPVFLAAMEAAATDYFAAVRVRAEAWEAERRRARAERERQLRPVRLANLAAARSARRRR